MASASTRNTIIAVFSDETTANSVVNQLAEAGISRSAIHVGSRADWETNAATGGAGLTGSAPQHHSSGFMGWLESLFGSDHDEQNKYNEAVSRGKCVVAVDADDAEHDRAVEIMENNGAVDIDDDVNTGYQAGGTATTQQPSRTTDLDRGRELGASETRGPIPVVKEELQVGKRAVRRGGVRVYTRTVEEPVEEQITLRDEQVRVSRRAVDRPVTDPESAELHDQVIEVLETAEEPVVRKQARVVEEVVVEKTGTQRTETVRDTLRNQQVEVEELNESSDRSTGGEGNK